MIVKLSISVIKDFASSNDGVIIAFSFFQDRKTENSFFRELYFSVDLIRMSDIFLSNHESPVLYSVI